LARLIAGGGEAIIPIVIQKPTLYG